MATNRNIDKSTHDLLKSISETKGFILEQIQANKEGKEPLKWGLINDDLPDNEQLLYAYNTLQWLTRMIASGQIKKG